jgi:hypothetical protein
MLHLILLKFKVEIHAYLLAFKTRQKKLFLSMFNNYKD